MSTKTITPLVVSRVVKADPQTVFRAWTEPEQLKRWSAPEGIEVAEANVDLSVGGRYHIRMKSLEGPEHNAAGVYRVIEPPRRLVYTWSWEEKEHDVGETLVTVEFNPIGTDSTEVILTHELFPSEEAKGSHETGWTSVLNRLEAVLA